MNKSVVRCNNNGCCVQVEMLLGTAGVSLGLVQSVLAHHGLVSPSLVLDWATLRHVMADLWHQVLSLIIFFIIYLVLLLLVMY